MYFFPPSFSAFHCYPQLFFQAPQCSFVGDVVVQCLYLLFHCLLGNCFQRFPLVVIEQFYDCCSKLCGAIGLNQSSSAIDFIEQVKRIPELLSCSAKDSRKMNCWTAIAFGLLLGGACAVCFSYADMKTHGTFHCFILSSIYLALISIVLKVAVCVCACVTLSTQRCFNRKKKRSR